MNFDDMSMRDFAQRYGRTYVQVGEQYLYLIGTDLRDKVGYVGDYMRNGHLPLVCSDLTELVNARVITSKEINASEGNIIHVPLSELNLARPLAGWVNTPLGAIYGEWKADRQWRRGLCADNTTALPCFSDSKVLRKRHPFEAHYAIVRWWARKVGNDLVDTKGLDMAQWLADDTMREALVSYALDLKWALVGVKIPYQRGLPAPSNPPLGEIIQAYYRLEAMGWYHPKAHRFYLHQSNQDFQQEVLERFPQVEVTVYG